jgi:hypothetical protein
MDDPITPAPGAAAPGRPSPEEHPRGSTLTLRRRLGRARRRLVSVRDLDARLVTQGERLSRLAERVGRQTHRLDEQGDLVARLERRLAAVEQRLEGRGAEGRASTDPGDPHHHDVGRGR